MQNASGLSITETTDFSGVNPCFSLKNGVWKKNIMLANWHFRQFKYSKKPVQVV